MRRAGPLSEKGVRTIKEMRTVATAEGEICYVLSRKRIKNLNLRVKEDGEIAVSVPFGCTAAQADAFVLSKADWIFAVLRRRAQRPAVTLLPELNRRACVELLRQSVERVLPLVEPFGVSMPEVKVRKMRSQWGNCHWAQGYITLNEGLHRCPEELRDYVALHELAHFLHHDHGPGFYAVMDRLMPDWRDRRTRLKHYGSAIHR